MTLNPAANVPNLASLSATVYGYYSTTVRTTVQNTIQTFLTAINETNYNIMVTALTDASNNYSIGDNSTLRLLVAIDDGTVAYDSSKSNTWILFNGGNVNSSNHNTRPEVLIALLGNSGVGLSERFSKSTGVFQKYQANRVGNSVNSNLGTFRVSVNTTL
jgi:hypothetical protein